MSENAKWTNIWREKDLWKKLYAVCSATLDESFLYLNCFLKLCKFLIARPRIVIADSINNSVCRWV